jgi:PAS domain S-box-containing protein
MIKAESVLDAAPDAMVIVDEKGTNVLANLQTERLFACDQEELIGKPVEALIPGFHGADLAHGSIHRVARGRRLFVHPTDTQSPCPEGGRIPAVALTAFARAEDRTRALLAGFQSHLAKPAEPIELLAVVAALVGRTGLS